MSSHRNRLVALGLIAFGSGCGSAAEDDHALEGLVIQSSVEGLAFAPHLAIGGPMPEADRLVYGAANVVESTKGRFYVLNSGDARVAAYDMAGEFVGTVGGQGDGPGEFSAPVGLAIARDDAVIILDAARFMLLEYDPDGVFLRDIRLDPTLGFPVVVAATPDGGSPEAAGTETAAHGHDDPAVSLTGAAAGSRWARLLARIYEVFPLRCPECGSGMRILAFLTDPEPTGAILRHLDLPHTPPRLSPARGPPQPAFDLDTDPVAPVEEHLPADDIDQTPAFDPADPEPLPDLDLDLDQTRGG